MQDWLAALQDGLYHAFIPSKRLVTPDYWEWMPWRCAQARALRPWNVSAAVLIATPTVLHYLPACQVMINGYWH